MAKKIALLDHFVLYTCMPLHPVLKYPVTILLILLIALQTFSKWCLILACQANKDYIAKHLCINRTRISCGCQGKCYLNKKLAGDESQQQSPAKGAQKEESPLQLFADNHFLPEWQLPIKPATGSTRYLESHSQEVVLSFFQPPQKQKYIPS